MLEPKNRFDARGAAALAKRRRHCMGRLQAGKQTQEPPGEGNQLAAVPVTAVSPFINRGSEFSMPSSSLPLTLPPEWTLARYLRWAWICSSLFLLNPARS